MFDIVQFTSLYRLLDLDMVEGDCGVKCEQYCCRAADAVKYFLPGEEDFFSPPNSAPKNFEIIDHFFYMGYRSKDGCNCACSRDLRPFCCRIFPFRPVIELGRCRVVDLRKARGAGFDIHCWVSEPLKEWRENAIEAWQFVLSDIDYLSFYARYALFLDRARARPDASTSSVLYDVGEIMSSMSENDLWNESIRFFDILGSLSL